MSLPNALRSLWNKERTVCPKHDAKKRPRFLFLSICKMSKLQSPLQRGRAAEGGGGSLTRPLAVFFVQSPYGGES